MSLPKYNENIISPNEKQYKKVSINHCVKNSFFRNTMNLSPVNLISQKMKNLNEYQQKISNNNFTHEDMVKLLQHVFNKNQTGVSDRNLIRRVLLQSFKQELICSGGRQFINFLSLQTLKKNEQMKLNSTRKFYFVLKGRLQIQTNNYLYKKSTGQHFGQLQILAAEKIAVIKAKMDSIVLTLQQQHFSLFFSKYFIDHYDDLKRKNSHFEKLLDLTTQFYQLLALSSITGQQFKTGDKVSQKGQHIKKVYLMNNVKISSSADPFLNQFKVVGLTQFILMKKPIAKQTVYCMENKTVFTIKVQDLTKYFSSQNLIEFYQKSCDAKQSVIKSNKSPDFNRSAVKLQSFVRIKKVKFNTVRRFLTESHITNDKINPEFTSSFVFLKDPSNFYRKRNFESIQTKINSVLTNDSMTRKRWLDDFTKHTIHAFDSN